MPNKDYNNLEYIAQKFRDFLVENKSMNRKYGWRIPSASHSVNSVRFNLGNEYRVEFFEEKNKTYCILEKKYSGEEWDSSREISVNIKKSKTGRISEEKTYAPLFEEICKAFKKFR